MSETEHRTNWCDDWHHIYIYIFITISTTAFVSHVTLFATIKAELMLYKIIRTFFKIVILSASVFPVIFFTEQTNRFSGLAFCINQCFFYFVNLLLSTGEPPVLFLSIICEFYQSNFSFPTPPMNHQSEQYQV